MKNNKKTILLSIGLLIGSAAQAAIHLTSLPDAATGTMTGIGIGLMILSFIRPAHTTAG